jgi:hypothetical protein
MLGFAVRPHAGGILETTVSLPRTLPRT